MKFLDLTGFQYFVTKVIGKTSISGIGDGTLTGAVSTHTNNKSNPHGVTKSQVGLSNVPNVATNDQTPSYTAASSLTALSSGEKLSVAFGKLSKAVSSLISHLADSVGHITAAERTAWNAKLDKTATAADSDKFGGLEIDDFPRFFALAVNHNGGKNGSGVDFNTLTQAGYYSMKGNFSAALNAPADFYGDSTLAVIGDATCITQMVTVGDKICFRKNAWNGEFGEWKYSANASRLKYAVLDETYLTTEIKNCTTYTDLFSQLPDRCLFLGHTWYAPSWFPNTYETNWHVKVEKYDGASIWIEVYSDAKTEWNYKAGLAYGNTWSGWNKYTTTDDIVKCVDITVPVGTITATVSLTDAGLLEKKILFCQCCNSQNAIAKVIGFAQDYKNLYISFEEATTEDSAKIRVSYI